MINSPRCMALTDGVASAVCLACAAGELLMRECYHRVSAESFRLAALVGIALLLILAGIPISHMSGNLKARMRRWRLLCAAFTASGFIFVRSTGAYASTVPASWIIVGYLMFFAVAAAWAAYAAEAAWTRTRRAICIAFLVFVGVQPVLVATQAAEVFWPPPARPESVSAPAMAASAQTRRITMFVLLDELNFNSSAPFVETLLKERLLVRSKAMAPVADGTAKVVPAMFARQDFESAKPCSTTAMCSGTHVLDFGRVRASRPDVDVVGFFHPYCAMRGLRYCERAVVAQGVWNAGRWRCGAWRRTGIPQSTTQAYCDGVYRTDWAAMTDELEAAIWRAPAWQDGGFLFVHVPLPHPPGRRQAASLQENYEENLARANALVRQMVVKAHGAGLSIRLVLFSDHPLRQGEWCANHWVYASRACKPVRQLEDTMVPLIVAGDDEPPMLDGIGRNDQIFTLWTH